jgi:putative FmdB family regulatory protein
VPTYEYLCESCASRYEKREGFDAPARQKCPTCGKRANRVLHAPPIVFKGSGFYKTDSRGTSSATTDSSEPAVPAASATAESTPAADSKPAKPAKAAKDSGAPEAAAAS